MTPDQPKDRPNDRRWLDEPGNVTLLVRFLAVVCLLLVVADLFYHGHGYFGFDSWIGFQAFFGFAAFIFIVLAGKQLRKVVMRDEDYYDR